MSDIFREVEEDIRRERFENIWKQYGDYIIAGVALIVIAIAGYELWQRYETSQRLKASETLIAAQQLADSGDFTRATPAFAVVAKDAPSGYAKMARLAQADSLLVAGQRSEAVAIYKSIADEGGVIGSLALARAGWALSDSAPRGDVEALLAPLLAPVDVTTYTWWVIPQTKTEQNAWSFSAREILAYADYHASDISKAQAEYKALADDKDASESLRRRAAAMAAFLKNGGTANYGTVPAPAPVTPTPATATTPPGATPAPTGTPPK